MNPCPTNSDGNQSLLNQSSYNLTSVTDTEMTILTSKMTTVVLPVFYIIVFAVGLPTNAMAICVFIFRTKKKHPTAIYMANLAVSDLLFVIWIPVKISYHFNENNWQHGEIVCKVLAAFFYGNIYCSVLFITCISVQRYLAVVYPMSDYNKNSKIALAVSVTVWVVICSMMIPLFFYDQTVEISNPRITTCHDITKPQDIKIASGFFMFMAIFTFTIPSVISIIAYVLILRSLKNSTFDENIRPKRRKTIYLIIVVLVMFVLCFAPNNIMLLVQYGLLLNCQENTAYGFYISTLFLASLNCCVDPFVYYFISEEFRDHVRNILICRSVRTVERMQVSFTALRMTKRSKRDTSRSKNK